MKDKKKRLQERIKEQKVEKREEKSNKQRKESIKLKRERIQENRPLNKSKKVVQDPSIDREMKFLSKLSTQSTTTNQTARPKSKLIKKKKWFS